MRSLRLAAIPAAALAALTALVAGGGTEAVDARLAALVRRFHHPRLTPLMQGLSLAGRPPVVTAAAAAVSAGWLRAGRRRAVLELAVVMGGEAALRLAIKFSMQRHRPLAPHRAGAKGYSFPSGHAMGTAALLGALLRFAWPSLPHALRPAAAFGAVVAAAGIGGSRVYLGVHHASDVAAGWLAALTWLMIALPVVGRARVGRTPMPPAAATCCGNPGVAR